MKKKYLILALMALVVVVAASFFYKNKKTTPETNTGQNQDLILYYGETCPHCKIVEAFLQENKISEKVDFSQKEVFLNAKNAQELSKKAAPCKIDQKEMGVPFLWNNGQCLEGDQDIINFFKDKAGIK